MASPPKLVSTASSRTLKMDMSDHGRSLEDAQVHSLGSPQHPARLSPTISRSYDPNDPQQMERQRTMDADFAMQLSRARSASLALGHRPDFSHLQDLPTPPIHEDATSTGNFNGLGIDEEEDNGYFTRPIAEGTTGNATTPGNEMPLGIHPSLLMSHGHEPDLLVSGAAATIKRSTSVSKMGPGIVGERSEDPSTFDVTPTPPHVDPRPEYTQPSSGSQYRSRFDFALLEELVNEERKRHGQGGRKGQTRRVTTHSTENAGSATAIAEDNLGGTDTAPEIGAEGDQTRPRALRANQNASYPKRTGGKLALFENTTATFPPFDLPPTISPLPVSSGPIPVDSEKPTSPTHLLPPAVNDYEDNRPYRFAFYSNRLRSTIYARSLHELPAEDQSFEQLFLGKSTVEPTSTPTASLAGGATPKSSLTPLLAGSYATTPVPMDGIPDKKDLPSNNRTGKPATEPPTWKEDEDANSWWLDILCPTDDEMRILSKCFGIHPLTAEDIQMEETREKIELFRNYYLVCFRSFDQDPYSPTYLEPINYYIVVFREGILSFHFRVSPHPQNVRRRIKQLKDYISVTSDWISYALIDDITDAFGPLIQSIEYEVDSIDELVLILKETEQSDMLRRIGTCRKKVMGLLRLMGNKADVVKGLAKRCNENWSMAPKSDIGLYLSDIQDHLITMTQSLNHYEKLLSRSHSNYLAQISIEMTDANNQINDVLSRLTALGTILIPMNLITGLWGMNVHVPGQDVHEGYAWFIGIICFLVFIGGAGSWATYRLMRRSRRKR
ncbi:cora-domain-containing protein [Serendipita vermifera]|nr:cora-domain-containing protein [Serendipita vermifera]